MNKFNFSYPTKVYFGEGAAAEALKLELPKVGKTVMLAYGGGSVKKNGIYDELKWLLLSLLAAVIPQRADAAEESYEYETRELHARR